MLVFQCRHRIREANSMFAKVRSCLGRIPFDRHPCVLMYTRTSRAVATTQVTARIVIHQRTEKRRSGSPYTVSTDPSGSKSPEHHSKLRYSELRTNVSRRINMGSFTSCGSPEDICPRIALNSGSDQNSRSPTSASSNFSVAPGNVSGTCFSLQ